MQQQRTNNNWGKKNGQVMHCMQTAHADSTLSWLHSQLSILI